jgi:hypothetical protein
MRQPIYLPGESMNRKYILAAIPAVALAVALGYFYGGSQAPIGQPPLQRLTAENLNGIKDAFNAAKDDARLLLLLSPT